MGINRPKGEKYFLIISQEDRVKQFNRYRHTIRVFIKKKAKQEGTKKVSAYNIYNATLS